MRQILYISLAGENRISCWSINSHDGRLVHLADTKVNDRPAPMAADIQNSILYVGRRDFPCVSSYKFNSFSGELVHLSDGPKLEGDPCYISVDKTNNYILSAYYEAGAVSVHSVEKGVFKDKKVWQKTGNGAHCVFTDEDNSYALLPHIAGERGLNKILKYSFNQNTGNLEPMDIPFLSQPDNRGPRHYTFHPNGKYVFFSNEQDSSVTAYGYQKGDLDELQTLSTLPAHYSGVNTCAQIKITPDGRYLYAPNRGHNSIAGFSVDPNTGELNSNGRTQTEAMPRVLDIDRNGDFLYSAGLNTGYISAFKIGDDGSLGFIDRFEVGQEPMWILILPVFE